MLVDAPGIGGSRGRTGGALQLRASGVIGPDGFPGHAMLRKTLRQQPGPNPDIGAGLQQVLLLDAPRRQTRQMRAVDLHQANVVAVCARQMAAVDGARIEVGLGACHGIQQGGRNAIVRGRFIPARAARARPAKGCH